MFCICNGFISVFTSCDTFLYPWYIPAILFIEIIYHGCLNAMIFIGDLYPWVYCHVGEYLCLLHRKMQSDRNMYTVEGKILLCSLVATEYHVVLLSQCVCSFNPATWLWDWNITLASLWTQIHMRHKIDVLLMWQNIVI